METKVAIIKDIKKDIKFIEEAAQVIKNGGIVAFPTETVYGLGANALNENSVKKIFVAKGRPQDNPLIVHVSSKDVSGLVKKVPEVAEKLINKFWPGPLTKKKKKKDIIPNVTSANLNTIGIRMPNSEIALKLIELSEKPIAAPSANISGRPSPTEVERCVEDLNGRVEYIIGGESSDIGVESTIIDCTVNPPMILRPGGITLEMLREIDSNIDIDEALKSKPNENLKPKAPGMKYKHYSPKCQTVLFNFDNKAEAFKYYHEKISAGVAAYLMCDDSVVQEFDGKNILNLGKTENEIAANLYEKLREGERVADLIIAIAPNKQDGVMVGVMNRMKKAFG